MDSPSSMTLSLLNKMKELLKSYGLIYKPDVEKNLGEMIKIHGIFKDGKVVMAL